MDTNNASVPGIELKYPERGRRGVWLTSAFGASAVPFERLQWGRNADVVDDAL
jgi:hypothetical protein